MYTDKILDLLCDITDNAGREAMWEYLKFECVPVLPAPQTDNWGKALGLKRLNKES